MNRREFISKTAISALGASALKNMTLMAQSERISRKAQKPNIVFILADDLGWDEPGCYGGRTGMKTPNIDRLSEEGVKFTYATGASMCSPARAQLLTGRYGFRTGMNANAADPGGMNHQLGDHEKLLPETFKKMGYRTGLFGKLHLHWNNADIPALPSKMGFDEYFYYCGKQYSEDLDDYWKIGDPPGGMVHDHFNVKWVHNGKRIGVKKGYDVDLITDKVNDFIKTNKDRPFVAWVPQFAIHEPFQTPDKWKKMYPIDGKMKASLAENVRKARIRGKWQNREGLVNYNPTIEKYRNRLAMGSALDASIGRVMEALEKNGIAENTILIVTSDNGPHPIAGGGKASMRDAAVRVPLIISWPKKTPAGKECNALVDNVDIYPTLVEAAGGEMPEGLKFDGISFLDVLSAPESEGPRDHGFACLRGELGLYDHNWFYGFSADDEEFEQMWARVTPPDSVQTEVPRDLVPEDVKERFKKLSSKYRRERNKLMAKHRRKLEERREKGLDAYGDRYEKVYGERR